MNNPPQTDEQYLTMWLEHSLKHAIKIDDILKEDIDGDVAWNITTRPDGSTTVECWEFTVNPDHPTQVDIFWDDYKSGEEFEDVSVIHINIMVDMIHKRMEELSK